jgi:hypothetical protein
MARAHSDFERKTIAERLNDTFEIGDRVKVYVPPTHEQMLATGRRAKHLLAWRGPCEVIEKLSSTTFAMREISTRRRFERALVNILPYKATTTGTPRPPSSDPAYSDPLTVDEFIAVRDEPDGPFYIALVKSVTATIATVHYYGSVNPDLPKAKFLPCWHLPNNDLMRRQLLQPPNHVPCSGELEIASLDVLLVARGLLMTASNRLRAKSHRALTPLLDDLFLF